MRSRMRYSIHEPFQTVLIHEDTRNSVSNAHDRRLPHYFRRWLNAFAVVSYIDNHMIQH